MLRPFAQVVGCCCVLLRKVWNQSNFSPNNSQPMLDPLPCAHYAWFTKTYGLYPSHDALSQHCWELLHPFANTHATTLNIVGATKLGVVASRLHAASVSKLKAESLLPNLIDVAVLLKNKNGWHRLRFMSAFNVYNDVSRQTGFKFFFPLGNLSLCDRKHESDQNPERPQPMLFPRGEPWGRGLVWPPLMTVYNGTWMF